MAKLLAPLAVEERRDLNATCAEREVRKDGRLSRLHLRNRCQQAFHRYQLAESQRFLYCHGESKPDPKAAAELKLSADALRARITEYLSVPAAQRFEIARKRDLVRQMSCGLTCEPELRKHWAALIASDEARLPHRPRSKAVRGA